MKKLYCIGIGWIGVSALARYYLSEGWKVFWSDAHDSELIHALQNEGCNIIVWQDSKRIDTSIDLVIHTEAIPRNQKELSKARELWIKTLKYSDALGNVANAYKLIAVAGTHGKSTTTSMISQILKNSAEDFTAVVGTLLREFDGKNFYTRGNKNFFALEACEYKEHFLAYRPTLAVITNIEYDHADYFKTQESYIEAFEKFIDNIIPWGFCIINGENSNCKTLISKRQDIGYIEVYNDYFQINWEKAFFPEIILHVPGEHILFDAKLAYIVWHLIGIHDVQILNTLEEYSGVWRRMEKVGITPNGNILMSDYGHHPTEIATTLKAIRSWFPEKKIYTIFQPHQYSRTLELIEGFKSCFADTDILIIPDIYESRDSEEDKEKINTSILTQLIEHPHVFDGKGKDNTLKLLHTYDSEHPNSSIILLLWAGDIDTMRYKIKTS